MIIITNYGKVDYKGNKNETIIKRSFLTSRYRDNRAPYFSRCVDVDCLFLQTCMHMNNLSRRRFIASAASLATLAVVRPSLSKLSVTDRDRLEAELKSYATISGQTFYLPDDRPVLLTNLHHITITGCAFIWEKDPRGCYMEINNCYYTIITQNLFMVQGKV